jgi:hypothetical protein
VRRHQEARKAGLPPEAVKSAGAFTDEERRSAAE